MGCYPDFQWLPASKTVTPYKHEMPDLIEEIALDYGMLVQTDGELPCEVRTEAELDAAAEAGLA